MKFLTAFFFKTIFIFFIAANSYAQTPDWIWAKSAGGIGNDSGDAMAKDSSGNIYIVGSFNKSISFGVDTLNVVSDSAFYGEESIYIAKFDPEGNVLWMRSHENNEKFSIVSCSADRYGNIYFAGNFSSNIITFGTTKLYNKGDEDIFIVKSDSVGSILWARSIGGMGREDCTGLAIDEDGGVFIGGNFSSNAIDFDTVTLRDLSNTSKFFIAKYNSQGNILWTKNSSAGLKNIVADKYNNIYALGMFGGKSLLLDSLTIPGSQELGTMFLVKYDRNGNLQWGKPFPFQSNGDSWRSCMTMDSDNIYLVGNNVKSVTFDTVTLSEADFMYIAKYDLNGNLKWAISDNHEGTGNCRAVASDNAGNLYIARDFFPQITLGDTTLYSFGHSDLFIVQYDTNRRTKWVKHASTGGNLVKGIIWEKSNALFIISTFSGEFTLGPTFVKSVDQNDVLFAKLGTNVTSIHEEMPKQDSKDIFPNPVKGSFRVNVEEGNWQISVYSLAGNIVHQTKLTNTDNIIDLSGKAKGMYIYQLQKEGEVLKTGKLVLE